MNNLIVDAWPIWGMVIAIMSVVYLLWPSRLMKKSEYAKFFLCSFSIYWLLMLALYIYIPPRDSFDGHNVSGLFHSLDDHHTLVLAFQRDQAESAAHLLFCGIHKHFYTPSGCGMDTCAVQQYVKSLLLAVFLCCQTGCYAEVSFAADSSRETSVPTSVSQLLQKQEDNFRASQRRANRFVATIVAVLIALLLVSLAFILRLVLRQKDSELDRQKQALFRKKSVHGIAVSPETMALRKRCAAAELPTEGEWQSFQTMIDSQCDGFARHLSSVYKLSQQELRVSKP